MDRYEFYSNLQSYQKNSLEHYGIIGQKWGKRRWQNSDGTFNAEGKERYFGTKGKKSESDDDNDFTEKEKYKDLKKQGKEKGLGIFERRSLAKYCMENDIDEITDKIVEGHKAGKKLYNDQLKIDATPTNDLAGQITQYIARSEQIEHVVSDKNVKSFTESNEHYKEYAKKVEECNKLLKKATEEAYDKAKKAGLDDTYVKKDENGNVLYATKEGDPEKLKLVKEIFEENTKSSKYKSQYQSVLKEARIELGKFEKDCHEFAKGYLVDQAEVDMPGKYNLAYEKDTGKVRQTKEYEYYGYLMTQPYWDEVGGP